MTRALAVVSTAYCLSGVMADGTVVRAGSVASNQYPLGTVLEVTPAPAGRRRWTVRDRIGWGTELDFWLPTCGAARTWGRRLVGLRLWRAPTFVAVLGHVGVRPDAGGS
jgi:3D (Asp-Asp-Asp) domain-containing protein